MGPTRLLFGVISISLVLVYFLSQDHVIRQSSQPRQPEVNNDRRLEEVFMEKPKLTKNICFPKITGPKPNREGQVDGSTTFGRELERLASLDEVYLSLEIGTYFGGGSTTQIANGLERTDGSNNCVTDPSDSKRKCCTRALITLEIYRPAWEHSTMYLQDRCVWCILGTSVNASLMLTPDEIPNKDEHFRLYYERDLKLLQNNEPQLDKLCQQFEFQFILIDGNEFSGWGEFQIIERYCKPKYLALHDTSSLKTERIENELRKDSSPYKIISKGKDAVGWAVYKRV